ncbi:MAG TPA: O-antigen ligase family protein [Roseiflexaceae bacterium]|nr:O-antigen ligase family protein [Roseiflexaceae bacterium]
MLNDVIRERWGPALGRSPLLRAALVVLLAATVGLGAGAAVTFGPFWAGFAALAALAAAYALLADTRYGLAAVFLIATVLPFGTLPFRAVVTPTLLTLALLALMGVWLLRLLVRPDERLDLTPLGLPLIGFLGICTFAFLLGAGLSPDATLLHNYVKFLLAVLLFFSVVNCVRTRAQARWALRLLMAGSAIAALVGLALYALPDATALQILVALGRIGYPTSGRVLRYVEDDPNGLERAIGLAVDPNSFGGMLALVGALTATQVVAERPALPRWLVAGMAAAMLLALFLTYSRAALGGIIVATMYVATLRYRRLWWAILAAGALAGLLLIGLGVGEQFAERVTEGVQFRDQANQMRLAEYQNALAIIQAYPVFGIGFGEAPELDLTAGVSSIYLAIAQRTGLVGLAAFLALMALFYIRSWRALRAATATGDDERAAWLVAIQAGVAATLAVGLLDHYFFNIEFSHMSALLWGTIGLALAIETISGEEAVISH